MDGREEGKEKDDIGEGETVRVAEAEGGRDEEDGEEGDDRKGKEEERGDEDEREANAVGD